MEEILIDEKKYISSKQAAKVTGYAKDYIGQLCREGRVPARLVGRSWYVLEAAIQDHRFGNSTEEDQKKLQRESVSSLATDMWESPRYEASPVSEKILPEIYRPTREAIQKEEENKDDVTQRLEDSWREWFSHLDRTVTSDIPKQEANNKDDETDENKAIVQSEKEPEPEPEEEEVSVPIHQVRQEHYQSQRHDLMPVRATMNVGSSGRVSLLIPRSRTLLAIRVIGIALAIITAALAVIGSGSLDSYIISHNQASVITGITIYNR